MWDARFACSFSALLWARSPLLPPPSPPAPLPPPTRALCLARWVHVLLACIPGITGPAEPWPGHRQLARKASGGTPVWSSRCCSPPPTHPPFVLNQLARVSAHSVVVRHAILPPTAHTHARTGHQVRGFQGRPCKDEDTCYSFWIGGALAIAGHPDFVNGPALLAFLHACQSGKYGGFSKALGAWRVLPPLPLQRRCRPPLVPPPPRTQLAFIPPPMLTSRPRPLASHVSPAGLDGVRAVCPCALSHGAGMRPDILHSFYSLCGVVLNAEPVDGTGARVRGPEGAPTRLNSLVPQLGVTKRAHGHMLALHALWRAGPAAGGGSAGPPTTA
jgi:hypothetical protein